MTTQSSSSSSSYSYPVLRSFSEEGSSSIPPHRHPMKTIAYLRPADTRMIDLRRSLPSLHSSLSPCRSPQESEEWEADRQAQLADAQEAARGMRRLFLATLLFWAAIYGWYLHAH